MKNKVLVISGTSVISGAEYVLGDYLSHTNRLKDFEILHSDVQKVEEFYGNFKFQNRYKSKYLNPVGATKGRLNFIKKIFNLLCSFFIFYKILKNKEIKTVLGNNTGDTIYSVYSHLFGKKHINYIHDMIEKDSTIAKSILFFDSFITKYIAVSNAVKNSLIQIGIKENKIIVIYNGLEHNPNFTHKALGDKIVFGFVGNIEDRKNPMEFVKFIEIAKRINKDKEISGRMVFGNVLDDKLFEALQQSIRDKDLPIELLGRVDRERIQQFYDSIHFLVLTSKKDPLPTVILEAFNNSVPAIGHKIDGVPEMIINGYNGFLYKNTDEFINFYTELSNLDEITYQQMSYNANLTIKTKFSIKNKVSSIDDILFTDSALMK